MKTNLEHIASTNCVPLVGLVLILASGCWNQGAEPGALQPDEFTLAEFRSLEWLDGAWRGAAEGGNAFYEGYSFVNDSTVEITYFADSTLTESGRTGSVYFTGGKIYHREGQAVWGAVSIDTLGVLFAPVEAADNSFRWTIRNDSLWTATILEAGGGIRAVFEMERTQARE